MEEREKENIDSQYDSLAQPVCKSTSDIQHLYQFSEGSSSVTACTQGCK